MNVIVVSEQLEDAQDMVVDVEGQDEKHDGVAGGQKVIQNQQESQRHPL